MSRRKQEKPQPRKQPMTAEADVLQDILTCGSCQKEFALSDIVKFIQHKVHTCNKENYLVYGDEQDDFPDKSVAQIVGRPSISAPISKKGGSLLAARLVAPKEGTTDQVPRLPNFLAECNSTEDGRRGLEKGVSPKPKVVDADTNTTITEPNSYTCATCKQTFTSAWVLVQHVQNMHGMKIYVESHSNRSTPASIPPSSGVQQDSQASSLSQHLSLDVPSSHSALQLLRMPLSERQFGATLNNPFSRPSSHDFRMEMLHEQYSRLNNHGINPFESQPHPFERGPFDRGSRTTPLALSTTSSSYEPQMDFYSQRLRQLAGATSPNATAAPSPVSKLTPPFGHVPTVVSSSSEPTTPTPTPAHNNSNNNSSIISQLQPKVERPHSSASSPSSNGSKGCGGGNGCSGGGETASSSGGGKQKACEFCGKTFRFLSNLIVHRRSHTGEKPFKCHICNHACTQASKLKRHMKTHRTKSGSSSMPADEGPGGPATSENNSLESARSTPDSTAAAAHSSSRRTTGGDGGADGKLEPNREAGDDEDSEEDGQTADNEEEEELDEDDEMDEDMEDMEEEDDEDCVDLIAEDLSTRGSEKHENPKSLLGEVMEKIGLSGIQQYNEAYKQALEESLNKAAVKQERPSSCSSLVVCNNGPDREERGNNNKMIGQPALDFGQGLLSAFDSSYEANKRLKLDMGDRESLYAGLWLPSVPSHQHDLFLGESLLNRHKFSSSESALKSFTPSSFGGSLSPRPGTSGGSSNLLPSGGQNKLKDRRNDTCEFCGKIFKNCSNLTVHRRSHTGEKPYKCELCSYACAQSSKLTRHMKTHGRLGKDVYRCRFCNMPFSVPSTLEKHMRKCVVNQNSSTPELLDKDSVLVLDKDSDSKEMTSSCGALALCGDKDELSPS